MQLDLPRQAQPAIPLKEQAVQHTYLQKSNSSPRPNIWQENVTWYSESDFSSLHRVQAQAALALLAAPVAPAQTATQVSASQSPIA